MRILHLIKTTDGARWALHQVQELQKKGVEIHVALPSLESGRFVDKWKVSSVHLHEQSVDFPVKRIWQYSGVLRRLRKLIAEIKPDIIHSHFVGTTLMARRALRDQDIPIVFQVPGPLHLEKFLYRNWDLQSAGCNDYWIASSKYIRSLYQKYGVDDRRLFHSYYGWYHKIKAQKPIDELRKKWALPSDGYVIGNMNYMYAPKYYLGHKLGIKRHELIIDALGLLLKKRKDVVGLVIGGAWGRKSSYEKKLCERAKQLSDRIILPGYVSSEEYNSWELFDLVVHTPLSENCGGAVEPLLENVPVIASNTGALPEVIRHQETGYLVPHDVTPPQLVEAIGEVLDNLEHYKRLAAVGQEWVKDNFDVVKTAEQVYQIYKTILQ